MTITSLLTRRFLRRALARPNLTYFLWRFVANATRTRKFLRTRPEFDDAPAIADSLRQQGLVVGHSAQFLTDAGERALRDAADCVLRVGDNDDLVRRMRGELVDPASNKDFMIQLVSYPDGIPAEDRLLAVALDRKLLEIVADYLGLWPSLYSVNAWLHYPTDAPAHQSQLWHRDPEDLKVVKVFIYLDQVDESCGPFSYIPGTQPFGSRTAAGRELERQKRVTDAEIGRVFPPESWRVCTGSANTMILADTVGYHRGGKPTVGRRILLAFTFTSGAPIKERRVKLQAIPDWASREIQRAAIGRLLVGETSLRLG